LRTFRHSFTVDASIDRVWDFYTDIRHLEVITPKQMQLKIIRTTTGQRLEQGTEVWLAGRLVTKSNWHSKITSLRPYQYVDEMLSGRFETWKHTHSFREVGGGTRVIDEIDFALPGLGKLFEGYAHRQLEKIFAHRKQATIEALRRP
jgi:ligand-binding SRPBCC domain-containing protein